MSNLSENLMMNRLMPRSRRMFLQSLPLEERVELSSRRSPREMHEDSNAKKQNKNYFKKLRQKNTFV